MNKIKGLVLCLTMSFANAESLDLSETISSFGYNFNNNAGLAPSSYGHFSGYGTTSFGDYSGFGQGRYQQGEYSNRYGQYSNYDKFRAQHGTYNYGQNYGGLGARGENNYGRYLDRNQKHGQNNRKNDRDDDYSNNFAHKPNDYYGSGGGTGIIYYGNSEYDSDGETDLLGYGYEYEESRVPFPEGSIGDYNYRGQGFGIDYNYQSFMPYGGQSVRFGAGGYGDPNYINFSPAVCQGMNQQNCTANDPDAGSLQWRFVKNIGYRKMDNYGAARKDWWDYKRSVPLPFNYFNFPRF